MYVYIIIVALSRTVSRQVQTDLDSSKLNRILIRNSKSTKQIESLAKRCVYVCVSVCVCVYVYLCVCVCVRPFWRGLFNIRLIFYDFCALIA